MRVNTTLFIMATTCSLLSEVGCMSGAGTDDASVARSRAQALTNGGALVQSIATVGAEDVEAFSIGSVHYLAVANSYDGTTGTQPSEIYRWNGQLEQYEPFQTLTTQYALDWEHFVIGTDHYLAVANHRSTSPWNNNTNSEIYRWNGSAFVSFQLVATHGASDWEHVNIAGEDYLVVANSTDGTSFDIDSQVLRFDSLTDAFVPHQSLATRHAQDWEVFEMSGTTYLAVANTKGGDYQNQTKVIDSVIYTWDSSTQAFVQVQTIQTEGALDWAHVEIDGNHYLAVANSGNDTTGRVDSVVYTWNGTAFVELQRIATSTATDIEPVQDGMATRLVIGDYFKSGTRNTDSYIYTWDGQGFAQPEAFPTHGVGAFEYVEIDGSHYLAIANQHDDTGFSVDSEIRDIHSDLDNDGVIDISDNCLDVANADQADVDGDDIGDACDSDNDNDGIDDVSDNCPVTINADQADLDSDGAGDVCDTDDDNDGIDDGADNCPEVVNNDQLDSDGNDVGDACDPDDDGDGLDDTADNCPLIVNPAQSDLDSDGTGDECDEDMDGDLVADDSDNCPEVANADQADVDSDGAGDACDDQQGAGLFQVDLIIFEVQPSLFAMVAELRTRIDNTPGLSDPGALHALLTSVENRVTQADVQADQLFWCTQKSACKKLVKQALGAIKSARLDLRDFRLAVRAERAQGNITKAEKRTLQEVRRDLRIGPVREMRKSLKRTRTNINQAL